MSKTFIEIIRHGEQPTRTSGTVINYQIIVSQWINRLAKKYQIDPMEIPPEELVADLKQRASTLSKNSVRQYKAALRLWLISQGAADALADIDSSKLCNNGVKATKRSIKGIKRDDWVRLISYIKKLDKNCGQYKAGIMLISMLYTGLRPAEWERATLVKLSRAGAAEYAWAKSLTGTGPIFALHVFNAKNTNGRGGDGERHVPVPSEAIPFVKKNLAFIAKHFAAGRPFGSYKSVCKSSASVLMRTAFPRRSEHYSLYSARHQFAAEMKSRLSKIAVADLMGHGSDTTAGRSYARATQSWNGGYSSDFTKREHVQSLGFKPKGA